MRRLKFYLIQFLFFVFLFSSCKTDLKKEYYKNGILKSEYRTVNGKPDGIVKVYYPDGKLQGEVNFRVGVQDGMAKEYFENGRIKKVSFFKDGIQIDTMKIYYESGGLEEVSYMVNNKKNGEMRVYYENGGLYQKGNVTDGIRNGYWLLYDSTENLRRVGYFKEGSLVKEADTSDFYLIPHEHFPINIMLPNKWIVKYSYMGAILVAGKLTNQASEEKIPIDITIVKGDSLKNETLSQYMNDNIIGLKKHNRIDNIVGRESSIFNGNEVEEVIFIGHSDNKKAEVLSACILHNKYIYNITCISSVEEFPFYQDLFQEIIRSIKFSNVIS